MPIFDDQLWLNSWTNFNVILVRVTGHRKRSWAVLSWAESASKILNININFFLFVCLFSGFHMTPQLSRIFPESCLLIVVGVVIGILLYLTSSLHVSPLTPDTFFLYMLPPIILDAGYFMPNRLFFDHLGTILLFAVIGTVFNTVTIGEFTVYLSIVAISIWLNEQHLKVLNSMFAFHLCK